MAADLAPWHAADRGDRLVRQDQHHGGHGGRARRAIRSPLPQFRQLSGPGGPAPPPSRSAAGARGRHLAPRADAPLRPASASRRRPPDGGGRGSFPGPRRHRGRRRREGPPGPRRPARRAPGGQRRRSAVPRYCGQQHRGAGANVVRVGFATDCEWRIDSVRVEFPRGTQVGLAGPEGSLEITSPWIGEGLARCTAAAAAVGAASGLGDDTVRERLAGLRPIPERLETVALPAGAWLLCDSWKSTWVTVESALHELGRIAGWRRIAVLGNIDEVRPGTQTRVYLEYARLAAAAAERIVYIGDGFEKFAPRDAAGGAGAGPYPGLPRRSSGRRGVARRARAGDRHPRQGEPPAEAGPDQASPAG